MLDLVARGDVLDALIEKGQKSKRYKLGENWELNLSEIKEAVESIPSAEPERRWIPFTMRELTTEEKEEHPEWDYMMDCKLPDDGEEILVSNGKYVWLDTFISDCDGCYLDGGDDVEGLAWMPLPEPWKGE